MIWIPALHFSNDQPTLGMIAKIRVSAGDHRLVVDNDSSGSCCRSGKHFFSPALAPLGRRSGIISAMQIPSRGYFVNIAKNLGGCPACARGPDSTAPCYPEDDFHWALLRTIAPLIPRQA